MTSTYGVLGVGAIARAIVSGLCEGVPDAPTIVLSPRSAATSTDLAARYDTVRVAEDNQAVLDGSTVVLVCLRQTHADLLADLEWRADHVVVSAIAGVGVDQLATWVAPASRIARSVPMPPVAWRAGLTAVHPPLPEARELFDRLGETLEVADVHAYEALSATSATLAGFFEYLAVQATWLAERGIPAPEARRYVGATYAGALGSLQADEPGFAELAGEYATPGGVNAQVREDLREIGTYDQLERALDRAHDRLSTEERA